MELNIITNRHGMALLMTITVITVLIAGALEWHRKARSSVAAAAAGRDRLTLSHMAASGVQAAMAMLIKDKMDSDSDSLREDWANPQKTDEVVKEIPFEDGVVSFKIHDELGKIQINALVKYPEAHNFNDAQRALWDRFLRLLPTPEEYQEDTDPNAIINSIKDWLDSGDDDAITGLSGAESGYYQGLAPPYSCGNGPMRHLGDLAMVKGVIPDIFQGLGGSAGISPYITVHGIKDAQRNNFTFDGRININTATLPVLTAMLPSESQDMAQVIYDYRQETDDLEFTQNLSNPNWYQTVPGTGGILINPDLITTSSDVFSIESTATLHEMKMTQIAVVQREKDKKTGRWHCRILKRQIK